MKSAEYQQSSPIQPKKDSSTQCDFIIRKASKGLTLQKTIQIQDMLILRIIWHRMSICS